MSQLTIVVTCTDRKAAVPAAGLRVRELPQGELGDRAAEWRRRLDAALDRRPLADLYQGDHWVRSLRLLDSAAEAGFTADLWVASAGLGLQPVSVSAPAYAATFTPRHEDSVGHSLEERSLWWQTLQREQSSATLTELADRGPLLLVLSEVYATAMRDDLEGLADQNAEALLIGGSRTLPNLPRVPADASLRSALGGTLTSLNARIAAWWLEHCSTAQLNTPATWDALNKWVTEVSKKERYQRTPMSDENVLAFIRDALALDPTYSRTRLLRKLRDEGLACEQKRFADLYATVENR